MVLLNPLWEPLVVWQEDQQKLTNILGLFDFFLCWDKWAMKKIQSIKNKEYTVYSR